MLFTPISTWNILSDTGQFVIPGKGKTPQAQELSPDLNLSGFETKCLNTKLVISQISTIFLRLVQSCLTVYSRRGGEWGDVWGFFHCFCSSKTSRPFYAMFTSTVVIDFAHTPGCIQHRPHTEDIPRVLKIYAEQSRPQSYAIFALITHFNMPTFH